jgi:hypothetical protein
MFPWNLEKAMVSNKWGRKAVGRELRKMSFKEWACRNLLCSIRELSADSISWKSLEDIPPH